MPVCYKLFRLFRFADALNVNIIPKDSSNQLDVRVILLFLLEDECNGIEANESPTNPGFFLP